MSTAEYMRRYRQTERGQENTKVITRAQAFAVAWVRENRPDVWSALLDRAWAEVAPGRPPAARRPRKQ